MSRLHKWLAMKRKKPLVLSWYCFVGTVADTIIVDTHTGTKWLQCLCSSGFLIVTPPKFLLSRLKCTRFPGVFNPLSDRYSNLSGKGYLSAALTIKILVRECVSTARRNKLHLAESEVIHMSRLLKTIFQAIWQQMRATSRPRSYRFVFTRNALKKCRKYQLSEENIQDVFYHGHEIKEGMIVRKYTGYAGYTVGLMYKYDKDLAANLIISCWKRTD